MPPEQYTKPLLVKVKLQPDQEFELTYEFTLPEQIPPGLLLFKFQLMDPLVLQRNDEKAPEQKKKRIEGCSDIMTVAINV